MANIPTDRPEKARNRLPPTRLAPRPRPMSRIKPYPRLVKMCSASQPALSPARTHIGPIWVICCSFMIRFLPVSHSDRLAVDRADRLSVYLDEHHGFPGVPGGIRSRIDPLP